MTPARAQARRELQLFGLGLLAGGAFALLCLEVLRLGGILLFVWAATRLPHAAALAVVVDVVLQQKPPGGARFLPVTAFTAGALAPVGLISMRYLF